MLGRVVALVAPNGSRVDAGSQNVAAYEIEFDPDNVPLLLERDLLELVE